MESKLSFYNIKKLVLLYEDRGYKKNGLYAFFVQML